MAIVSNLEQFKSTIFHNYFNGSRAGIHGILDQLLEGVHWCYYNLARSDLIYHVLVERLPASVSLTANEVVQEAYLDPLRSVWRELRSLCLSLGTSGILGVDLHTF